MLTCVAAIGCATFPLGPVVTGPPPTPPRVAVSAIRLVSAPTPEDIARWLCPEVAPSLVCQLLAGGRPSREAMRVVFDVQLDVENPNTIPLPLVAALVAFKAYPDAADAQNLGAACLTLCEDPASCTQDATRACESNEPSIRDADDFARAATNFLIAVATGRERFENLRVRTLAPGAHSSVVFRLELDPEQVFALVSRLATDAIAAIRAGRAPSVSIPYEVEGSVWVVVEHFGRFAASFPPFRDAFVIR